MFMQIQGGRKQSGQSQTSTPFHTFSDGTAVQVLPIVTEVNDGHGRQDGDIVEVGGRTGGEVGGAECC